MAVPAARRSMPGIAGFSLDRYFTRIALFPTFAVMLCIFGIPLLFSFYLSFTGWSMSQALLGGRWVGLANYEDLLADRVFVGSLGITFGYTGAAVAAQMALGLAIALLLNVDLPRIRVFRTALVVPMMITPIVGALCWKLLLDPSHGVFNYWLGRNVVWLGMPGTALLAVWVVNVWQNTPYVALILLAGLRSLPSEPLEAASIDGASRPQMFAGSKLAATYDGKLSGIPYRITTGILHYQKPLLEKAGFSQAPGTFAEFQRVALAVNSPPERYGVGLMGKQGSGLYTSLASWRYSAGGRLVDWKTGEVFINDSRAVTALQFMGDLVVKHKVTPPEVTTWEYDEIIAGGQRDRYVMAQTFAPYGTLINDPAVSKTAGRWAWSVVPGHTDKAQSRTWIDGHFLAVPKYAKHADWSLEFIRMACSKEWMRRSMERGNARRAARCCATRRW